MKTFKEALKDGDLERLRKIDKTDFHNHAGLGMTFDRFEKWCGVTLEKPPLKMDGIAGLDKYIGEVTCDYVTHRKGFEFSLEATIKDAIEDGVKILETSIDCCNMGYYDCIDDFTHFIRTCENKYSHDILFRPEIGVFKGLPEKLWIKYVIPCIKSKTFDSIDFYGTESIYDKDMFLKYIDLAKSNSLKVKYHIGEFCTSEVMFDLIKELKPDEIQHGIQAFNNKPLMDYLRDEKIILHICPSSNVVLGAVASMKAHPISILHRHGIRVTINTDDLLLFNSSVSQEYLKLYKEKVLTADELDAIRQMGLLN